MLELKDVNKSFPGAVRPVLDDVSLEIRDNEFLAVTGRSGSGKSTLLNVMSTLLNPDSGDILYHGNSLMSCSESMLNHIRRTDFSVIFQFHYLLPYMTALENTLLPFMQGMRPLSRQIRERGRECLDRVGLGDKQDRLPGGLSGGEQQRVAIARALVKESGVLFADEPTGSLDRQTGSGIMDLLESLHGEGMSIVMVTHDESYALRAGRVVHMEDGRLLS